MTLLKLKSASIVLIEDDYRKNIIPLLHELVEKKITNVFCFEQPVCLWKKIFKSYNNVVYYEDYHQELFNKYTEAKGFILIDSVNQMLLRLGWNETLKILKKLSSHTNISKVLIILHKDSLLQSSKLQLHLNYIASAVISFDASTCEKILIQLRKGSKLIKSEEILTYDSISNTLKSTPVMKNIEKAEEPEKTLPSSLSTFKIEVGQTEKLERYKLKLPYMNKINEGESKVFYEPDAVDDWDEEDPDDDLNI